MRGIIEVKSTLRRQNVKDALQKLSDNAQILEHGAKRIFLSLFSFDEDLGPGADDYVFKALQETAGGSRRRAVNHVCIGPSRFTRFWANDPFTNAKLDKWFAYSVDDMASGYFIFNALEVAVGEAIRRNIWAWFPRAGKEIYKTAEAPLDAE